MARREAIDIKSIERSLQMIQTQCQEVMPRFPVLHSLNASLMDGGLNKDSKISMIGRGRSRKLGINMKKLYCAEFSHRD